MKSLNVYLTQKVRNKSQWSLLRSPWQATMTMMTLKLRSWSSFKKVAASFRGTLWLATHPKERWKSIHKFKPEQNPEISRLLAGQAWIRIGTLKFLTGTHRLTVRVLILRPPQGLHLKPPHSNPHATPLCRIPRSKLHQRRIMLECNSSSLSKSRQPNLARQKQNRSLNSTKIFQRKIGIL